jgi:hypothetical protein
MSLKVPVPFTGGEMGNWLSEDLLTEPCSTSKHMHEVLAVCHVLGNYPITSV